MKFIDDNPVKGLDKSFVGDLLKTKYVHWAYEEELRIFLKLDHLTIENGSYFYPFDAKVKLKEVILGPLCELPIDRIRSMVRSGYDDVTVIKARLAFKWFHVVPDERSVQAENEYWESSAKHRAT